MSSSETDTEAVMADLESNAPPLAHFFGTVEPGTLATIEVGPDREPYEVHKPILTRCSSYFRNALSGSWKESSGVVTLTDVEPGVFKLFVQWLYTQDIEHVWSKCKAIAGEESCKLSTGGTCLSFAMIKLLVLADRFTVPKLFKEVNNHFVNATACDMPPHDVIIYAYDNLPPTYRVLDFLADAYSASSKNVSKNEQKMKDKLPYDFLLRAMSTQREMLHHRKPKTVKKCDYHEHDDHIQKAKCTTKLFQAESDDGWDSSGSSDSHGLVKSQRRLFGCRNIDDSDEDMRAVEEEDDYDDLFGGAQTAAQTDFLATLNAT